MNVVEELKKQVEQAFGEPVLNVKHCQRLSESISDRCGQRISDSTIRRIWGMLGAPRKPSVGTLDLLSRYIGAESWTEFLRMNDGVHLVEENAILWSNGKDYADKASFNTATLVLKKAGVDSKDVVARQCIDDQMDALLESDYMATGVIAPGGYGKSLGIASWVLRSIERKSFKNSIVYFLTGNQIDDIYSSTMSIDKWLSTQVFKTSDNVFTYETVLADRQFILIVDALDEIDSTLSKSENFLSKLVGFISRYSNQPNIKVIVSTRSSIWSRSMVHEVLNNSNASSLWMGLTQGIGDSDFTNLPLLNHKELQEAINNFINKKQKEKKLLVEQLNFMLKETISHPYMLKLFISIYNSSTLRLQSYNDVIDEFISQEIVHSKYSDEKLDIINFLLKEQKYGRNLSPVRKNTLKEVYPIHLRKNGNYFAAYEHLLAYRILSEETIENKFKNLIVQVDFSHSNLRDLLITRYLVEENGGISDDLFLRINREFKDSDLRLRLICNLYSIAYTDNNFEAIKDFHRLPESISRDKEVLKYVINQFRNDKPILSLIVREYSRDTATKQFLTNTMFDFDYLNTSYSKLLEVVLEHAESDNETIYCLAGLAISRAQMLDWDGFRAFSEGLKSLDVDDTCGAYTILVWSIWKVYEAYIFTDGKNVEQLKQQILKAESLFVAKQDASSLSAILFYLEVLPHLLLFKEVELASFVFDAIDKHPSKELLQRDAKLAMLYDLYRFDLMAIVNGMVKLSPMQSYNLEQQVNALSISQSYINRISGYVLLACSYLQQDDKQKFVYYYQTALEICSNAKFKLLEISKVKYLAQILELFNMQAQAKQFRAYSETIVGKGEKRFYEIV